MRVRNTPNLFYKHRSWSKETISIPEALNIVCTEQLLLHLKSRGQWFGFLREEESMQKYRGRPSMAVDQRGSLNCLVLVGLFRIIVN